MGSACCRLFRGYRGWGLFVLSVRGGSKSVGTVMVESPKLAPMKRAENVIPRVLATIMLTGPRAILGTYPYLSSQLSNRGAMAFSWEIPIIQADGVNVPQRQRKNLLGFGLFENLSKFWLVPWRSLGDLAVERQSSQVETRLDSRSSHVISDRDFSFQQARVFGLR